MDLVTIPIAIATGAALAALSSVLLDIIKDKLKDPPPRVVIKKGSRTLETFFLTDDQLERLRKELEEGYQGNAPQSAVNN